MLGIRANPEANPPRLLLKVLPPVLDLTRMNLVPLRGFAAVDHCRSASRRSSPSAASIFRFVFFVIRSIYHDSTVALELRPSSQIQEPAQRFPPSGGQVA